MGSELLPVQEALEHLEGAVRRRLRHLVAAAAHGREHEAPGHVELDRVAADLVVRPVLVLPRVPVRGTDKTPSTRLLTKFEGRGRRATAS